jgi:hypothetical protein
MLPEVHTVLSPAPVGVALGCVRPDIFKLGLAPRPTAFKKALALPECRVPVL